jgi:hypothetical protein
MTISRVMIVFGILPPSLMETENPESLYTEKIPGPFVSSSRYAGVDFSGAWAGSVVT